MNAPRLPDVFMPPDVLLPAQALTPVILDDSERQPCEVWTRVMGYHRPVASFNIGKQGEFHERTWFEESRCHATQPA
jgi:hypothetical protein